MIGDSVDAAARLRSRKTKQPVAAKQPKGKKK
jgi:hypothetical protein